MYSYCESTIPDGSKNGVSYDFGNKNDEKYDCGFCSSRNIKFAVLANFDLQTVILWKKTGTLQ